MTTPIVPEALPYGPRMSRWLPVMHRGFLVVNRWLGVPIIRAGLAPAWSTPFGGYFVLLRTRGRTSGVMREAPLGYGLSRQRLRDGRLRAAHAVVRTSRPIRTSRSSFRGGPAGRAEEVSDPAERLRGMRAAAIGCGLIGMATLCSTRAVPATRPCCGRRPASRSSESGPRGSRRARGVRAGSGGLAALAEALIVTWWAERLRAGRLRAGRPGRRDAVGPAEAVPTAPEPSLGRSDSQKGGGARLPVSCGLRSSARASAAWQPSRESDRHLEYTPCSVAGARSSTGFAASSSS